MKLRGYVITGMDESRRITGAYFPYSQREIDIIESFNVP